MAGARRSCEALFELPDRRPRGEEVAAQDLHDRSDVGLVHPLAAIGEEGLVAHVGASQGPSSVRISATERWGPAESEA